MFDTIGSILGQARDGTPTRSASARGPHVLARE
jgi:hypothetical protein